MEFLWKGIWPRRKGERKDPKGDPVTGVVALVLGCRVAWRSSGDSTGGGVRRAKVSSTVRKSVKQRENCGRE